MRITLFQWILIYLVRIPIFGISFVEKLRDWPERSFFGSIRLSILGLILCSLLTGYLIDTKNDLNLNFLYNMRPSSQNVLGAKSTIQKPDYPIYKNATALPSVSAISVYAVDISSQKVLVDINSGQRLAPASTTKLMTALISMDLYDSSDTISIPDECTTIQTQSAGFKRGEKIIFKDLLNSLLVMSAGDSACALSESKMDYSKFIELMNSKATELGMENSHFENPIGLDSYDGGHYSTARDLYTLAYNATKNEEIKKIVAQPSYTFVSGESPRTIYSTNILLSTLPGSVGIKTGTTVAAKEVLIYEYNKDGIDLIIVVMGSDNRFDDTRAILDWILDNYSWGEASTGLIHFASTAG